MNLKRAGIYSVLLLLMLAVFFHFGRPVWHRWLVRVTDGRSVEQVLDATAAQAVRRFPDLDFLTNGSPITLLALKEEQRLEVWKQQTDSDWTKVAVYRFTAYSGKLGPKLKEGDRQIPEGIYAVEGLNPNSAYHLSIKVGYPNKFDQLQAHKDGRDRLGGDIFIHGENVTIGCIPIGNEAIEDVFYLVAANGYTNSTVIIAPFDMRIQTNRTVELADIDWEDALYSELKTALQPYPVGP